MRWCRFIGSAVLLMLLLATGVGTSAFAKNDYVKPGDRGPNYEYDPYEQHEVDYEPNIEELYEYNEMYLGEVNAHHNILIKLSKAVHPDSIHNIHVVDSENYYVDVTVKLEGPKAIRVYAPASGYNPGESYELYVEGLFSRSYRDLSTPTIVYFDISNWVDEPADEVIDSNEYAPLTPAERELANLINAYRVQLGLQALPISKSLTHVARMHVQDSNAYSPENGHDSRGLKCNLHSWSANGAWNPVCYTEDHYYAEDMWSKPWELTAYKGDGYEISNWAWHSSNPNYLTPAMSLRMWQNSPGHNAMIVGEGTWSDLITMGVAIEGNYSHVWFGEEPDPAGYY